MKMQTIDAYVERIKQVPSILNYGELLFWKCLKIAYNHMVLFPIENLSQAVETAKKILIKEKLDSRTEHRSPPV